MNDYASGPRTAHVALYDTMADWEIALLLTELRTGRFTLQAYEDVFYRGDASAYPALMQAAGAA